MIHKFLREPFLCVDGLGLAAQQTPVCFESVPLAQRIPSHFRPKLLYQYLQARLFKLTFKLFGTQGGLSRSIGSLLCVVRLRGILGRRGRCIVIVAFGGSCGGGGGGRGIVSGFSGVGSVFGGCDRGSCKAARWVCCWFLGLLLVGHDGRNLITLYRQKSANVVSASGAGRLSRAKAAPRAERPGWMECVVQGVCVDVTAADRP